MPRSADDPLLLTPWTGQRLDDRLSRSCCVTAPRAATSSTPISIYARDYMVGAGQRAGRLYWAVPLPGSATYANEAVISAWPGRRRAVDPPGRVYGDRLIEICNHTGIACATIRRSPRATDQTQFAGGDPRRPRRSPTLFGSPRDQHRRGQSDREAIAEVCRAASIGLLHRCRRRASARCCSWCAAAGRVAVTVIVEQAHAGGARQGIGWSVVQKTALENARGISPAASARPPQVGPEPAWWDRVPMASRFTPLTQVMRRRFAQACREHAAEARVRWGPGSPD